MKRTLKKLFSLILCAAILVVPTFAAGESGEGTDTTGPVMVWGKLTWLDNGGLLLQNDSETALNEVILHGESIICLDAVTGETMDIKDLEDGDTVYAWVSPVMTLSMPPQTTAYLILGNIPADYRVPQYYEIIAANVTESDSETQMPTSVELTAACGTVFTVTDEATLTPYLTKNIVTLGDLVPAYWFGPTAEARPRRSWYSPMSTVVTFPAPGMEVFLSAVSLLSRLPRPLKTAPSCCPSVPYPRPWA